MFVDFYLFIIFLNHLNNFISPLINKWHIFMDISNIYIIHLIFLIYNNKNRIIIMIKLTWNVFILFKWLMLLFDLRIMFYVNLYLMLLFYLKTNYHISSLCYIIFVSFFSVVSLFYSASVIMFIVKYLFEPYIRSLRLQQNSFFFFPLKI